MRNRNPVWTFVLDRWLAIVLVILAAVFIAENRAQVSVLFFFFHLTSPLWFILLVLFFVGLVVGLVSRRRHRRT